MAWAAKLYGLLAAFALVCLLYVGGHLGANQIVAMAIGGAVGAVEILGRYRPQESPHF